MSSRLTLRLEWIALVAVTSVLLLGVGPESYGAMAPATAAQASAMPAQAVAPPPGESLGLLASQTFELHGGWNAIWLDVAPEVDCEGPEASLTCEPEQIFADLLAAGRLESVWAWDPNVGPSFVNDPAETLVPGEDWLVYFAPGGPEEEISDLFALFSHRPYLVHLTDGPDVSLEVVGRPAARPVEWMANSFNLVGFPIDPDLEPTFDSFFAASEAHMGQEIYRLAADSTWQQVDRATERMRYGEAYWVFSAGPSSFSAPLEVELDLKDHKMDYDAALLTQSIRVRPLPSLPSDPDADPPALETVDVSLRMQPAAVPVPLSYSELMTSEDNPEVEEGRVEEFWIELPVEHVLPIEQDSNDWLELAVRRNDFDAAEAGSILHITDGRGTRWRIPVSASQSVEEDEPALPLNFLDRVKGALGFAPALMEPFELPPGLWVGNVTIDKVSVVHPTPLPLNAEDPGLVARCTKGVDETSSSGCAGGQNGSTFDFRLLIHADDPAEGDAQAVHLLTEVIAMKERGTDDVVLVSRDGLIDDYDPLEIRDDGSPFSRRVSTAAFDFTGPLPGTLDGELGRLSFDVGLSPESPTNPFKHRYHPDHDDLDAQYLPLPASLPNHLREVYTVQRRLTIIFDPPCAESDTQTTDCLLEGADDRRAGRYEEIIEDLHASPIKVGGRFELSRVSDIDRLER